MMMSVLKVLLLSTVLSTSNAFTVGIIGSRNAVLTQSESPFQLRESKQPEYGTSLVLPDSYVRCGKCQTVYAITEEDLGVRGRGRRLECSVCGHSWFQSKDRLLTLRDGNEMVPLPQGDLDRISNNIEEGKTPSFMGEMKIYVGNIAFECHEDDINQIFSKVGSVGDVSLVRDETGRCKGFGFVTMRTKEEGQKAIDELDGTRVRGRNIAVRESNN